MVIIDTRLSDGNDVLYYNDVIRVMRSTVNKTIKLQVGTVSQLNRPK